MNLKSTHVFIWMAATFLAGGLAFGGGIGDGTLPFRGSASLPTGMTAHLELRSAGSDTALLPCAGNVVGVAGRLELAGASYPIRGACVVGGSNVRLEAATSAQPIELQGRFDPRGFEGTMRWSGQNPSPVRFSVTP